MTGTVGLDGSLAYTAEVPLSKTLVGKEAAKYLEGVMVNVPIAGTVKTPTIDSAALNAEIKRLVLDAIKKSAVDVVGGLLNNLKL